LTPTLIYFSTILWNPIGQYIHDQIRVVRIICFQMHPEVVRTIHPFMHHEDTGLYGCAFTGLEYHRTDGQLGRSASLQYFDVRLFFETKYAISAVRDFDGKGLFYPKFHIAIINLLLIYYDGGCSTAIPILSSEEKGGNHHKDSTERQYQPRKILLYRLLSFILLTHHTSYL
jgi:hypothetical protein